MPALVEAGDDEGMRAAFLSLDHDFEAQVGGRKRPAGHQYLEEALFGKDPRRALSLGVKAYGSS